MSVDARNVTCAEAGLEDDLSSSEKNHTLDFLRGSAPGRNDPDRIGTVVATSWGNPLYLLPAAPRPNGDEVRRDYSPG
ncbi:hypothetical protein [Amycolatopsis sp. NPDC051372]|uniref:hypothetical protein n=1 Tax=Amycolatopsis sp. NPDC051372 TaxID=3155669 RepID=UPI0034472B28